LGRSEEGRGQARGRSRPRCSSNRPYRDRKSSATQCVDPPIPEKPMHRTKVGRRLDRACPVGVLGQRRNRNPRGCHGLGRRCRQGLRSRRLFMKPMPVPTQRSLLSSTLDVIGAMVGASERAFRLVSILETRLADVRSCADAHLGIGSFAETVGPADTMGFECGKVRCTSAGSLSSRRPS
jgi:hypothetical protein